jgi:carbonic anhydrase
MGFMFPATILAALVFVLSMASSQEHQAGAGHDWSYSGATGPEHWGDLGSQNAACKLGREQSPIDIRDTEEGKAQPVDFNYQPSPLNIINNGHTIQINYAPGSKISVDGKEYEVVQFRFHHPSEEKVQGKVYDMVTHIVHKDSEGHLAVVAVLMQSGKENPFLRSLWTHLPSTPGKEQSVGDVSINVADLLPATTGYYTFEGSLTTPPCSEGVRWFVLKSPVEVSPAQLAAFAKLYPHNARPIQPTNGRRIEAHP